MTEIEQIKLRVANTEINFSRAEVISLLTTIESQKEKIKRMKEHIKPLYNSEDKVTHLIACRVLRDPDRYPPKFDEQRFS